MWQPTVSMMSVPFFHVGGAIGMLGSLYSGNTYVVQDRFDAGEWLRLVAEHRVTSTFLVPTMLQRILDHPDFAEHRPDVSGRDRLRRGRRARSRWCAGRWPRCPHVAFANVFGQTETLGAYTTLLPDDHRDPGRVGSVGRPLPGVEVRVVDPDTGDDVEAGTVGELWVNTSQNVSEGWLHTGDLARQDSDGYIFPSGRLNDTINRGGEKFGPIEVEEALRTHPAVSDVAVAGVADDEMGQRVGAAVVARAPVTLEELRVALSRADRLLQAARAAGHRRPDPVQRHRQGQPPSARHADRGRDLNLTRGAISAVSSRDPQGGRRARGRVRGGLPRGLDAHARRRRTSARLLWYTNHAHGSGLSYNVVTITGIADGAAWESLARRTQTGDLRPWMRELDNLRHEVTGKILLPVAVVAAAGGGPGDRAHRRCDPSAEPVHGGHRLALCPAGRLHPLLGRDLLPAAVQGASEMRILDIQACFQVAHGSYKRREKRCCGRRSDDANNYAALVHLLTTDIPPEHRGPGSYMFDALKYRDQWESRLLRTSDWSPLY